MDRWMATVGLVWLAIITSHNPCPLFGWLWMVLICCKIKVLLAGCGWWLMLIWYEKKTLLVGWLTSQTNSWTDAYWVMYVESLTGAFSIKL